MSESKKNQKQDKQPIDDAIGAGIKRKYIKPKIIGESLVAFGALCNGVASGGRKAATGAPNFCNATKLLS